MSQAATNPSSSGTQSPPLEATGEDKPMGASSVDSGAVGEKISVVKDEEQRSQYLQPSNAVSKNKGGKANPEKLGESMADKFDKMD